MSTEGVSFLHEFDLGNRDPVTPGSNILSVTGTAAGDFDKANMTTESLRHCWRSADVSTWQEIVIQAEQTSNIDTFAILGHNFSPTAVVRVQANIANNFLAPPVDFTMVWSEWNMIRCGVFGGNYSHYRVRVLDPANPCGYIQIGRIVGGRAFTFIQNEDITDNFEIGNDDLADMMKTEGFFRVSNERVKVKSLSMKFDSLRTDPPNDANYLGLKKMVYQVGETRPFLTILDRQDPSFANVWGQIERLPNFGFKINRYMSTSLRVVEVF